MVVAADENPVPPNVTLVLEHVYGYRGRECTNNVHFLPSGEVRDFDVFPSLPVLIVPSQLVYPAGGIAVIRALDSHQQRCYTAHCANAICWYSIKKIEKEMRGLCSNPCPTVRFPSVWPSTPLATLWPAHHPRSLMARCPARCMFGTQLPARLSKCVELLSTVFAALLAYFPLRRPSWSKVAWPA